MQKAKDLDALAWDWQSFGVWAQSQVRQEAMVVAVEKWLACSYLLQFEICLRVAAAGHLALHWVALVDWAELDEWAEAVHIPEPNVAVAHTATDWPVVDNAVAGDVVVVVADIVDIAVAVLVPVVVVVDIAVAVAVVVISGIPTLTFLAECYFHAQCFCCAACLRRFQAW